MRLCKVWKIDADDITIRTGRVVDGVTYTDEEYAGKSKYGSITAPPAMAPAWIMPTVKNGGT